jgi:cystathionine beta-lyase/cystathionine gamma-synthase
MTVAEYLQGHKAVEKVFYPGLAKHPQNKLAREQMNEKFGGMISFTVKPKKGSVSPEETALKVRNFMTALPIFYICL